MEDCIFCKIIAGEIPSTKVWEDDKFLRLQGHQSRRTGTRFGHSEETHSEHCSPDSG